MSIDIVVSICAVVIAGCALITTIRHNKQMMVHNRLSVTPHLSTTINRDFDARAFEFRVRNTGVGPAIIRKSELFYRGKSQKYDDANDLEDLLDKILSELIGNELRVKNTGRLADNSFMSQGDSLLLVRLIASNPAISRNEILRLVENVDDLGIRIEYESIYGELFVCDRTDTNKASKS